MNTISGGSGAFDERHERGGALPGTEGVMCFGEWARTLRDRHSLTRREAEHVTDISRDYLKDIENGAPLRRKTLYKLITGYRLTPAQARLTCDLWRPPRPLPPVSELRARLGRPALMDRLDRSGIAVVYLDPAWNILAANTTFFQVLPAPGVRTTDNLAAWSLPPAPERSPAKPLLLNPAREGQWLVGMLRGGFAPYRTSPQVRGLYRQLTHNSAFNHHWRGIHVAHGRDLGQLLRLRNPATHQEYTLDLQITEITDAPEIRSFIAWPPQTGPQ